MNKFKRKTTLLTLIFCLFISNTAFCLTDYVVSFNCDEGIGTSLTSGSITGLLTNVSWQAEKSGSALKFDRALNGNIKLDKQIGTSIKNAPAITFSAWIKPQSLVSSGRFRLFGTYLRNAIGIEIYMLPESIVIGTRSDRLETWRSKNYSYRAYGEWVHLSAVLDYAGKTIRLYLNGYEMPPVSLDQSLPYANDIYVGDTSGLASSADYIGGDGAVDNTINGLMDEIKIYKRALQNTEITQLASTKSGYLAQDLIDASNRWVIIQKMKEKMNDSVVMYSGNSNVYVDGSKQRIKITDYQITPQIVNSVYYIPLSFTAKALGMNLEGCDVTEGSNIVKIGGTSYTLCAPAISKRGELFVPVEFVQLFGFVVFRENQLCVISTTTKLNVQTDAQVIAEIKLLFTVSHYKEPYRDHTAYRTQIAYSDPVTGAYIGSPSMIRLQNGDLLASHDYFGTATGYIQSVYKSVDNGISWIKLADIENQYWSTMFEQGSIIYLLGTTGAGGNISIRKSIDGGVTWSVATTNQSGILFSGIYHCGPTPLLKTGGRIYKAFEYGSNTKSALFISAPENCDLLAGANWTKSNQILYNQATQPQDWVTNAPLWIEGNMVQDKNGQIWDMMRIETNPTTDKAAMLKVTNNKISFDPTSGYINFPGGMSLFNIKYDSVTDKYLALVNNNTDPIFPRQRNVLSLSYSDDLVHWNIAETVLVDSSSLSWEKSVDLVAFQYADWLIDGDDMIFVTREASDGANNFHNANRLVFYRIKDYKRYMNYVSATSNGSIMHYYNSCETNETLRFIIAQYEGNILKQVKLHTAILPPTEFTSVNLEIENSTNEKIKAFIWKNEMVPIDSLLLN